MPFVFYLFTLFYCAHIYCNTEFAFRKYFVGLELKLFRKICI